MCRCWSASETPRWRFADEPVQSPLPQTEAAAKSAYENKLICTTEKILGSYIGKRKCQTQMQIDERRAGSREWLHTLRANAGINVAAGERPAKTASRTQPKKSYTDRVRRGRDARPL